MFNEIQCGKGVMSNSCENLKEFGSFSTAVENEAIDNLDQEFKCRIKCEKIQFFDVPEYHAERFPLGGRWYKRNKSFMTKKINTIEKPDGFDCDRITVYEDEYGERVVALTRDIPCYDDELTRKYDRLHSLFFVQTNDKIHAVFFGEGDIITEFTIFENVMPLSSNLTDLLKNEGLSF